MIHNIAALVAGTALGTVGVHAPVLTAADTGRTQHVAAGTVVTVQLEATPSAGYGWTLIKARGLAQQGKPVTSARLGSGAMHMVGGPQIQTFRIKVVTRGRHVLTFHYARPWEHVAPAKTVAFRIDAR